MASTTHAQKGGTARQHVSDAFVVGALTCAWIGTIFIVGVRGNFPINDDWAYATMVRRFLQSGEFQPTSWTFTPTITNTLIGAAATRIFGFSHEVLRCTNLFMGWLGMMGAYVLFRSARRDTRVSSIGAICYGFNPIHLSLSFTFMTDIAFAAFFTWSLAFAVIGARGHASVFLPALAASFAAVLSRQPGAVLPAAMLGAGLLKAAKNWNRLLKGALALLLASCAVVWIHDATAAHDMRVTFLVGRFLDDQYVLYHLAVNTLTLGTALGLLCLPIAVLVAPVGGKRNLGLWLAVATLAGTLLLLLFDTGRLIPSTREGVLNSAGVSNFGLHGYGLRPHLPTNVRWLISLAAALSASWILVNVLRQFVPSRAVASTKDYPFTLCVLATVLYLLPVSLKGNGFDRYVLPLVAPAGLLLLQGHMAILPAKWPRTALVCTLIGAFFTVGALGTRDHLMHLRLRNELIELAQKKYGAPPNKIQGGFEYDGYVRYASIDPTVAAEVAAKPPDGTYNLDRMSLRHRSDAVRFSPPERYPLKDTFLVSLSPQVNDFKMLESRPWRRLLTLSSETIYLHRRIRETPAQNEASASAHPSGEATK